MDLSSFDYHLPPDRIAQHPAVQRDGSRLLVIPRQGTCRHRRFSDITDLLQPGDLLIRNNTRVLPARLIGRRSSGGRVELLLLEPQPGRLPRWRAMGRPGKALRPGRRLFFGELNALVCEKSDDGTLLVEFDAAASQFERLLEALGRMPLPPYIERRDQEDPAVLAEDRERYQTVYAAAPGAVAAPTAGLHFTPELLAAIASRGVEIKDLTLHVGAGTFLPIRSAHLDDHLMHDEWFDLPAETSAAITACRARGGRLIAVGTTCARVLETLADDRGQVPPGSGRTQLFIKPGHHWRAVDVLITNFHLPKSTLLVLVCAFAGTARILAAYHEAIAAGYRFYSYGDACWIEKA